MKKKFNVAGLCVPQKHYMVNLHDWLEEMKKMIDEGAYFTIHRARQYGKTTLLHALESLLKTEYFVISIDFQKLGTAKFENENIFSLTFASCFLNELVRYTGTDSLALKVETGSMQSICLSRDRSYSLYELFKNLNRICGVNR